MTTTNASPAMTTAPIGQPTRARTRSDDLRSLPAALSSEWIKLSTVRSTMVILALTAVVGGLIAWALAATSTDSSLAASELFIYPLPLVAMLAAVTGILMFTTEAQHGVLVPMLTARPARWVLVTAKTIVAACVGMSLGVAGMTFGYGGAVLGGAPTGSASDVVGRAAWALLYISLAALIGLGVGMIVRHSAGAISGLLMWSFVVESLFAPALPDGVLHFLPFSAGYRLLDAGPNFDAPVVIEQQLARPQYALIFGAYALLALVVGTVLLYRRDAD